MSVGSSGPVVGHDSDAVIDDSTNDKIGLLSHEGTDPTDRPGRSAGVRQSLPCGVKTPEKAPNKANLGSQQAPHFQEFKSETARMEGQKQSQLASGERRAVRDRLAVILTQLEGKPPVASGGLR